MTAIDYPALLAQLEQQRRAVEQEAQDIDAIIDTVRRRAGAVVPAGLTLLPVRAAKAKPPAGKGNGKPTGHSNITDTQLATMRRGWEAGTPVVAIAKAAKVSEPTVRTRAKAGGWKRPKKGTTPTAATRTGTQLAGSITCNWCQLKTSYDPCQMCGKKLKREWT
jgi:hypothetical protein